MQIPNIKEFDSGVYEFRPWLEYEQIERAWASKRALGYPFRDLTINTTTTHRIIQEYWADREGGLI